MSKIPPYELATGVIAGRDGDYIKTVTVVTTDVVDDFGMVVDRDGLHAIREEIMRHQSGTNAPEIIVFVRSSQSRIHRT